jgi:hypothetical protein
VLSGAFCLGVALFNKIFRMALARGRPFMIPITRNIKDVDNWHRSSIADEQDGPVASMAAVRRDLVCCFFCSHDTLFFSFADLYRRTVFSIQFVRFAMALRIATVMDRWWLDRTSFVLFL